MEKENKKKFLMRNIIYSIMECVLLNFYFFTLLKWFSIESNCIGPNLEMYTINIVNGINFKI